MPGEKKHNKQPKNHQLSKLLEQLVEEAMMLFYMQIKNSKHSHILDQRKSVTGCSRKGSIV